MVLLKQSSKTYAFDLLFTDKIKNILPYITLLILMLYSKN